MHTLRATLTLLTLAAPAAAAPVTYIPALEVTAAFAKGAVLFDSPDFAVHASHRDAAGQAEVHEHETDVIYVLEGSATFVTGGTVIDGRTTAPHEIRGTGIEKGDVRTLHAGDVVIVPVGVPHWFKEVPGPFSYYVVKVR